MTKGEFCVAVSRACLRKEGLAFFAFIGACGAGAVMTALLAWNIFFLQGREQTEAIANLAYGMLVLIAVTQLSLHRLLGSKQSIELEFWKLKATMNQGDADVPDAH
jgi:hypothetical protein